jgi:3-oxoadipate enol-lactonase
MDILWNGQTVKAREFGQGPNVILVHGYPLDGAMWSGVARALSNRFRVFKLDLPGHGENLAAPEGSVESYADFLEAVLANVQGPAGIAGFSMGGYAVLALMKRSPAAVAALALVDTRAGADDEAGKAARGVALDAVRAGGPAAIVEGMLEKLLSPAGRANEGLVERLRRMILRQKPEALESDLAAMRDRPDSRDLLPRIAIPTLILTGEADVITPPAEGESMAGAIPGARFVLVPGAGHMAPMERPGAVASALSEHFAAVLA